MSKIIQDLLKHQDPQLFVDGEDVQVTPLNSGASNDSYLIQSDSRILVFKETKLGAIPRLMNEFSILAEMQGCVGPIVYSFRPRGKHYAKDSICEEYIDGEHLSALDLNHAAALGKKLRQLHEFPVERLPASLDVLEWNQFLELRLKTQLHLIQGVVSDSLQNLFEQMLHQVNLWGARLHLEFIQAKRVLVHTDLIPPNVLFRRSQQDCVFIDWEWARIDVPEWDLASIYKTFQMDDQAKEVFRKSYGLDYSASILDFITTMHYLNVALWRCTAFYVRRQYYDTPEHFIRDLQLEIEWIKEKLEIKDSVDLGSGFLN